MLGLVFTLCSSNSKVWFVTFQSSLECKDDRKMQFMQPHMPFVQEIIKIKWKHHTFCLHKHRTKPKYLATSGATIQEIGVNVISPQHHNEKCLKQVSTTCIFRFETSALNLSLIQATWYSSHNLSCFLKLLQSYYSQDKYPDFQCEISNSAFSLGNIPDFNLV